MVCPMPMRLRLVFAAAASLLAAASAQAAFVDVSPPRLFRPFVMLLTDSIGKSIGRALPVPAASAGIIYDFDPLRGTFVRAVSPAGQIFLERPDPIARGHVNFSLAYERIRFDTLDGKRLESLRDTVPIPLRQSFAYTIPLFGIQLETQEVTASLTYGLTNDIEVNAAIPVLYTQFGLNLVAEFPAFGATSSFQTRLHEVGVGDLLLRGKYAFIRRPWVHAAFGLVLRIPSGNQDNFQSTGAVEVSPLIYVSQDPVTFGKLVSLQPYLNVGVDLDARKVNDSEARWGVGLDCAVAGRFTVALAILARHAFSTTLSPHVFDVPRARGAAAPLFGIEPGRPDFFDASIGGRVNLWRDTIFAFATAIAPLNRDGFRSDVIPLAGVEATL